MNFNLGFIGGGNMSTAIFRGIIKNDAHPSSKIWVSGPHPDNLHHWSQLGANITQFNADIYEKCDVIFLGVKPGMLKPAIDNIINSLPPPTSGKNILYISMLAGISIEDLCKTLQVLSQDVKVIRIMPNMPMSVGTGACIYTPGHNVSSKQCELLEKLLSGCGICQQVPESQIDSLGVLTSCGPAFMYLIIEALADGAVKQGVPRATALKFAAQMVIGSGQMVMSSGKHPSILKDEVCSPGGSTICGITALEKGSVRASMINAIEAAVVRTKELGKK